MLTIPIILDLADLQQKFNISREQVDDVCDNMAKTLAARYAQKLEGLAQSSLHKTRERYIRNIRVIDSGRMEGTVMLDYSKDKLIRMIEEGASAFDMKEKMLSSPKAKISAKGGRYITIPFRWGTPGALGESSAFSGIMPSQVYSVAKKMTQDIPMSGGGMRSGGLDASLLPTPFSQPQTRGNLKDSSGKILFHAYEHKTSLYQGMVKSQDSATGQNRYFSFRRVSSNSDPDAFIHPGIEQHGLVNKALAQFDQTTELERALDIEWDKLF